MIQRFEQNHRMSQAVTWPLSGRAVTTAGIVADVMTPDATVQTQNILDRIDQLLATAGAKRADVVTANIWLADIKYFADMNKAWDAWVEQGHAPVRACVESKLAHPSLLVEIQVTAVVP